MIIKYWFKILLAPDNKYIKLVYNLMLQDLELLPNKVNWASLLHHLLMSLGFNEVWNNQGVGNINVFLSMAKQRLTDNFLQGWQERLNNSALANFYSAISKFQSQPYLDNFNIFKFSQAQNKLRMSSHRLEIEASRWARTIRIPIYERKCSTCGKLEDEYHFVIECVLYLDLKKRYISPYFWKRPSMYKFVDLINSTNVNCMRKLSAYIYHAFKYRTDVLYRN